jgi:ankyrin repeat protein
VVKALLEAGVDANKAANNGFTPLQIAPQRGHLAVVKLSLGSGADIHKTLRNGCTVLMIAVDCNHLAVVKALLEGNGVFPP